MKIYKSAEELIGKTPLLELTHIEKELGLKAKILAKLEYFNPAGSVKDRVALHIIEQAEKSGRLVSGSIIIEPTSGNTGIGLAALAAVKGYKVIITMPETMSRERQLLMRAYGAELVLTEGAKGMAGAIAKEINVGGTSISRKEPDIESLPPIAAAPNSNWASNAPSSAAKGLPQRVGSLCNFSKNSCKVR